MICKITSQLGILNEFLTFQDDCGDMRKSKCKVVITQKDFAENFTCEGQYKMQAAHWNQANV